MHMLCGYHRYSIADRNVYALRSRFGPYVPCVFQSIEIVQLVTNTIIMPFEISKAREHFPALKQDQVFLDNAGGSQALGDVIDS
jgi:hypothetical protein